MNESIKFPVLEGAILRLRDIVTALKICHQMLDIEVEDALQCMG